MWQTNGSHNGIHPFHFNLLRKVNSVLCNTIGTSGEEPGHQSRRHRKCRLFYRVEGREDALEVSMATHSSILAWKIPMDREAWQAIVHRVTNNWTSEVT